MLFARNSRMGLLSSLGMVILFSSYCGGVVVMNVGLLCVGCMLDVF